MKVVQLAVCLLSLVGLAGRADAQVLYGATSAGGPGELFTLNPANGAMIQDLGPTNDAAATNYPITGLAFNPVTGVLYGSTGNSVLATAAKLVTINPATARVTVIGSFNAGPTSTGGTPATMADLAFTASGQLYGVGSIGGPNLYSIDLTTGQATLVGSNGPLTSTSGGGLAISPTGTVYGSPTSSRFGTYDPATGVYTNIGTPSAHPGGAGTGFAALAFGPDGTLYGDDLGTTTHLVTFNPADATVTDLGPSVTNLDAIAFSPAPVPEPGTLALLAGPVALGLVRTIRRRK